MLFRSYLVQAGGERVICEGEAAVAEWRQRMVFQVNVRNVGEQRKVAEQIRRAEKLTALGQLVAGVAHELNNPLAIVMGRAQLLLRQPGLPEKVSGDVNSILRQGERASMIVRDLLSYARPREPNKTPVQLNQVIRDVVEWRRTAAESARVRVRLKLDNALPPTLADRVQVEQILNNLVGNAIDALKDQPSPRELELTSEVTASSLRLTVHDNGPGIPAEVREKIVDPFFTTKPLGQGTGLGLTICNTYVTEHRGKLWVETEDGRGTTFFVELPLLDCGEPKPPAPAVAPKVAAPAVELAAAGGGGQRLLIIDDEPDIVMVLESILSESGFQITTANNGNDALHLLSNQDFDVVLSDIRMPGLDGQALYQRVSALKPAMAKRVVFVTGDTVSGATRDFLDKTGNLWLAKPFQLADVLQRVQEVLRRQLHPGAPAVALTG